MFGLTTGVTVSLLVALCSFAVHTYGQNEPEVNTNLLRQVKVSSSLFILVFGSSS